MAGAVSTHSRLKAAGARAVLMRLVRTRFNTQPPEGGWSNERLYNAPGRVSTHSRLKAAGILDVLLKMEQAVSTHSRLKAAGIGSFFADVVGGVSTHSRLKAAGANNRVGHLLCEFQHTAA